MSGDWHDDFVAWRKENSDKCDLQAFQRWFTGVFADCTFLDGERPKRGNVDFRCKEPDCGFVVADVSTEQGSRKALAHMHNPCEHVYQIVFGGSASDKKYPAMICKQIRAFVLRGRVFSQSRVVFEALRRSFVRKGCVPQRAPVVRKRKRKTQQEPPERKPKRQAKLVELLPIKKQSTMPDLFEPLEEPASASLKRCAPCIPAAPLTQLPVPVLPVPLFDDWYQPGPLSDLFSQDLIFSL